MIRNLYLVTRALALANNDPVNTTSLVRTPSALKPGSKLRCRTTICLECCHRHGFAIANSFCNMPAEKQVTHYEPGTPPLIPICPGSFSVLDLLLVPRYNLTDVQYVSSDRFATLASSHFPVTASIFTNLGLDGACRGKSLHRDWAALQTPAVRRAVF